MEEVVGSDPGPGPPIHVRKRPFWQSFSISTIWDSNARVWNRARSEAWRMLFRDVEGALQRDSGRSQNAFVERLGDEGDAVRNAARRRNFGNGCAGSGAQSLARFGDLDEAGAQASAKGDR